MVFTIYYNRRMLIMEESNSLKTIQKLNKVGKVLSKIVFICCLVGAIGCIIGIVSAALMGADAVLKIGGVSVYSLIEKEAEMSIAAMYAAMFVGMAMCFAEAVVSRTAERYFSNELAAGTPFTFEGAKEMLRLGIIVIAVPLGTTIVCAIGVGIVSALVEGVDKIELGNDVSVTLGIMFIVMSVIFRYGAELRSGKEA